MVKITHPKIHTAEEIYLLLEDFKNSDPEIFHQWVSIENKGRKLISEN